MDYAMQFVGVPYRWGGDDPMQGFDCSGLAQELLASVGEDPPGDQTAHTLYRHFKKHGRDWNDGQRPQAGCLAFYGSEYKVTHVAMCIDDYRMIEAGGGGSNTTSVMLASSHNAYVRIRPINSRSDLVSVIRPNYYFLDE
jgi:cell wall-associated NlpC family hydrolase